MKEKNINKCIASIFSSKLYEGMPMTIIESYGNGIPVISSNIGNTKLLVKNRMTGMHFNVNDVNSLIECINSFDEFSYIDFIKNTTEEYKKKYSKNVSYDEIQEIYYNILFK